MSFFKDASIILKYSQNKLNVTTDLGYVPITIPKQSS